MYDDLIGFLILILIAVFAVPLILSIVAMVRSGNTRRTAEQLHGAMMRIAKMVDGQATEIAGLRRRIAELTGEAPEAIVVVPPPPQPTPQEAPQALPAGLDARLVAERMAALEEEAARIESFAPPVPPLPSEPPAPSMWDKWKEGGLERQFGAVLPVWIGGIALAFAGFFLVKYSIENNLIGPEVRVILGGVFAIALLAAARYMSGNTDQEGNQRIAQSLAGAGIAVLYVTFYAATMLYTLLTPFTGFVGMAGTTVLAVILALRHGPPIALMGMVGGFLTPALISTGNASAILLFSYLLFVLGALMIIIRRQGWWLLALPALIFAFGWVLTWVFWVPHNPGETLWVGMFIVAVAGTIVAASRDRYAEETANITTWSGFISLRNRATLLNVLALAGSLAVMAVMAFNTSFDLYDWVLFGVLAAGGIGLAYFDTPRYGFVPWAAMAVNAVMLAGWTTYTPHDFTIAVAGFGTLYALSGLVLLPISGYPLLWAGLSSASSLGYFLLAYFRLVTYPPAPPPPLIPPMADPAVPPSTAPIEPLVQDLQAAAAAITHVWGALAMALSLVFLIVSMWAAKRFPESWAKERVMAIFALSTTAFLAIALSIELPGEFLSVAIAGELLAVAWVAGRTNIPSLRHIAALLGLAFGYLLLPQILLLVQLGAFSVLGAELQLQDGVPIAMYPLLQLGLPAAFFLLAAYLFRRDNDNLLVHGLELAALALFALMGHYVTAQLFHPGENVLFITRTFLEQGIMTNVMFGFGVLCLVIARLYGRRAFGMVGVGLSAVALFRIGYFDMFIRNPLWHHTEVAGLPVANALAITFLLPLLWIWLAAKEFAATSYERLVRWAAYAPRLMLVLVFVWVNFEIRRLYQGSFLDGYPTGDGEFYTYSVVWLLFGLGLLFAGTLRGNQFLRYTSLALMLLAVTKVFLFDAGSLTGLYRVFSFLGLGLSLIGLSYFYGRFVFGRPAKAPSAPEAPDAPEAGGDTPTA